MIRALFTSATGMNAQQTVVDTTANNLANVNTTGFKRMQPQFQDLIYLTERTPGSIAQQGLPLPTGLQVGHGVAISGNQKVFTPGTLINTSNPYDVAVDGDGFFQVLLPNGQQYYTRAGNFSINSNGNLVTSDGFLLSPQISIPQNALSVSVGTDGTVSVMVPGSTAPTQVGQLQLTRFQNPAGLSNEGRNLYSVTQSSGQPIQTTPGQQGAGFIRQGFLEGSNVDVVAEMVNLILAQRAYEFNTKSITTADQMLSFTTNLIR
jgi:flagellar basal-body rod protein FlgG